MARAPGFLGLLLLAAVPLLMPGSPVRAQQTGAVRSDPVGNMTRAQLEAELEVQQSAATNPSYSEELREQAMMEAAMIRRRLEQGDFLVGDDLEVTIVGHPNLSDTYKIGPGSTLLIEGMGEISVAGVLRSEIEGYLQEELERYIRDPVVRARPTIRLSILGAVGNPGFYNLPSTALLSDAIMMAGGPGGDADLDRLEIERRGEELWGEEVIQDALAGGRTLDQLNLQAGDQINLPSESDSFWSSLRIWIPVATGVGWMIYRLTR